MIACILAQDVAAGDADRGAAAGGECKHQHRALQGGQGGEGVDQRYGAAPRPGALAAARGGFLGTCFHFNVEKKSASSNSVQFTFMFQVGRQLQAQYNCQYLGPGVRCGRPAAVLPV